MQGLRADGWVEVSNESHGQLKHETRTTLIYAGLVKRTIDLGYAPGSVFKGVKWKALEDQLYSVPYYKRVH